MKRKQLTPLLGMYPAYQISCKFDLITAWWSVTLLKPGITQSIDVVSELKIVHKILANLVCGGWFFFAY
jgi:hypothetical protein